MGTNRILQATLKAAPKAFLGLLGLLAIGSARAGYPVLDAAVGLPNPELITVYPDDTDKNLYYFVPTSMAFAYEAGKPRFGVQYWGLTGFEANGSSGAAVTATIRPAFDNEVVTRVADALKNVNPSARFAFPTLLRSGLDVIVNGAFFPTQQTTSAPTAKASTVDGTQAFTIAVNDLGARAFAQGLAQASDVVTARYRFAFAGVEKRLHARVTVFTKRVYDHFKASGGGSAFFGLVKTEWNVDWQKLLTDGAVKLEILEGGEADTDAYLKDIFKRLAEQKIAGEGMFRPTISTSGLPGPVAASGGGIFGWSFAAGGGWEHLEESHSFTFEINTQKLGEREFELGMSFSGVCARYPDHFVDLTSMTGGCIDTTKFTAVRKAVEECVEQKLKKLAKWKQDGLITASAWEKLQNEATEKPCVPAGSTVQAVAATPSPNLDRAVGLLTQRRALGALDADTYTTLVGRLSEHSSAAAVELSIREFGRP